MAPEGTRNKRECNQNPEDLSPLRPFLSSKETLIILDNAESVLNSRGDRHSGISAVMEELSQFKTACLCITSLIMSISRHCKRPAIPTSSIEAACDIFYDIYDDGGRSDIISDLLRRLDFHSFSMMLLATIAFHNMWDCSRLAKGWDTHRTQVLRTNYDESLAATIELPLTSPTFRKLLNPDAQLLDMEVLNQDSTIPAGCNHDERLLGNRDVAKQNYRTLHVVYGIHKCETNMVWDTGERATQNADQR